MYRQGGRASECWGGEGETKGQQQGTADCALQRHIYTLYMCVCVCVCVYMCVCVCVCARACVSVNSPELGTFGIFEFVHQKKIIFSIFYQVKFNLTGSGLFK